MLYCGPRLGPGSALVLPSTALGGCSPDGWCGRACCGDPPSLALSFRNEGCVCAKPQARRVLPPTAALPLHGAKSTGREIKASKLYLRARIHTLKSLTEPPGLSQRLAAIQPYRAFTSQAAAVWPKRGRIRSRDNREQLGGELLYPLLRFARDRPARRIPAPSTRRAAGTAPRLKPRLPGTSTDKSPVIQLPEHRASCGSGCSSGRPGPWSPGAARPGDGLRRSRRQQEACPPRRGSLRGLPRAGGVNGHRPVPPEQRGPQSRCAPPAVPPPLGGRGPSAPGGRESGRSPAGASPRYRAPRTCSPHPSTAPVATGPRPSASGSTGPSARPPSPARACRWPWPAAG